MKQSGLFLEDDAVLTAVRFYPSFEGWQVQARRPLKARVKPSGLQWVEDSRASIDSGEVGGSQRGNAAFVALAAAAACYRAEDRWALLYRVAWRLVFEQPHLLDLAGDPDIKILDRYAKAVRRDAHKMKAFVRFREVLEANDGLELSRYVAWFEPDHLIVEFTANFFRKRFSNMAWSILTPDRSAHYSGEGDVWFTQGARKSDAPVDDKSEEAWRAYYRNIFNPARVKVQAMRSEMPQKYWKNLPEAADITRLLLDADQLVQVMHEQAKVSDELLCGPRPMPPAQQLLAQSNQLVDGSLSQVRLQAQGCQRCSLVDQATQVVFGEGPQDAHIMLVGEQPGHEEDLAGRPFVGPAGQLLDKALAAAGLDRNQLYVTNCVKHFKFKATGKRRIHQTPDAKAVFECGVWLASEIALVDPQVIVCLGLTAAQTLLQTKEPLRVLRKRLLYVDKRRVIPTVHPSYVLRLADSQAANRALAGLIADLKTSLFQFNLFTSANG